ncbi:hypothetical protein [Clostridium sardiniense]|uniref:hypothetical protein n=1 Tax=Clostridium sardiniense TaxID=29369 RepID=UPI003D33E445
MDNLSDKLKYIFELNGFRSIKETDKGIKFENKKNKEIIYLIPNKRISIVLNPDTISEELKLKSEGLFHSTVLREFPKRLNNGQTAITYGYSFKFDTEGKLNTFLNKLKEGY